MCASNDDPSSLCRDVRVDAGLNKFIWSQGVRNVAKRVRVRLSRKRNEDEEANEKVSKLQCIKFLLTSSLPLAYLHSTFTHFIDHTFSYTHWFRMFLLVTSRDYRPKKWSTIKCIEDLSWCSYN